MKNEGYFNFRWIIVGVSFVLLALTYGAIAYSFSVFFVALLKEFSWNRSITGGAFSVFLILHGVASPFIGSMVDRFGPRKGFYARSIALGNGTCLVQFDP